MKQFAILLVAVVVIVNGVPDGKAEISTEGSKRDSTQDPLQDAENAAGKAVLHLLDAKIGRKVQDAAKEVTDFLTSAIGSHATSRADHIRKDKQKEMSLLNLGAMKITKQHVKQHEDKPQLKKKKDGSFLVHFKIPYMVTPVNKPKKHHHHHHHKYHHHHHQYHYKHKTTQDKPPPVEVGKRPYHPAYSGHPSPYAHSTSYTPGYPSGATHAATMAPASTAASANPFTPCQGMCTAPCTPQCTPATDCCCCPDPSAAIPPSAVPVSIPPPPMMPPPMPNPNQPPLLPEQFMQLPLLPGSPLPLGQCPQICKRHCIAKCPNECCGGAGKRNKVEKPSKEDKPEKVVKAAQKTEQKQLKDEKKQKSAKVEKTSEDQREEGSANEADEEDDNVE